MITILDARNPRRKRGSDDVTLEVRFSHMPLNFIEFTASSGDVEPHGRYLHQAALNGKFGSIEEVECEGGRPPSEGEQRERLSVLMQESIHRQAPLRDAKELGVATEKELARLKQEQLYSIALMRMPESDGWPERVEWPVEPTMR